MGKLPKELKLTLHAQQRLAERKDPNDNNYNVKNLMKSSCKWYTSDDLIPDSSLYIHSLYVRRKAKTKMGYITDGKIEILYDKRAKVAITVMEVKEKFLPITQYIKPEILKQIEKKKELKRMKKILETASNGICTDCGKSGLEITMSGKYAGLCHKCKVRKSNAKSRGQEYVPYIKLSDEEKRKVDARQALQSSITKHKPKKIKTEEVITEIPMPELPVIENYYQVKAEQNPAIAQIVEKPKISTTSTSVEESHNSLINQDTFISSLKEYGCEISETNLKDVLNVLVATDKLKDIFMTIVGNENQDAILNLEQILDPIERKLQYNWEYNGFQEEDDIKYKNFLTWRKKLKGAIFFWKKLYQTNTLVEMQRAWNAYETDINNKLSLIEDRPVNTELKKYQITTESISTIFNTKRPFTRVFFATSEDEAYKQFVKWMSDRQLHENKSKTIITELKLEGEDGRKGA